MADSVTRNIHKRLLHFDVLRILAIFLVVFNHTGERGYMLFTTETESLLYFLYMAFSIFCKIAVPIFFMISGALLLPKEESIKQLFTKRILRIAVVLLIISVPYYFWLHRAEGIGVFRFLTYIYGNSASTSLWYLYSYIGLLLLLPFLRSMVKNMKQKDFVYLFVGHILLVGVLPCLEFCLWEGNVTLNESFSSVIFVSQNVFYSLMGYYLEHVLTEHHNAKKTMAFSIVFSIVAISVMCLMTHYQRTKIDVCSTAQQESFFDTFICIPAMTVFLAAKLLSSKSNRKRTQTVLSVLGASVFGVYLVEKIVRALVDFVYTWLSPIIGSFVASLAWCLATCCIGFMIIIPLKYIPFLKNIVNKFI